MAKYMLIMRGTDESVAKMMETPFEQMLERHGLTGTDSNSMRRFVLFPEDVKILSQKTPKKPK